MRNLKRSLKACLSLFRIKTAEGLQYRAAALASASTSIFWALIEISVYTVFYNCADNKANTGLSLAQLVTYIWLGQALWPLQPMSIDSEVLQKITNGDVGVELCRPLDLYFHWFAKSAAGRLGNAWWRVVIIVLAGIFIPAAHRLGGPASAEGFALFLLSAASSCFLGSAYGMLVTAVRLGITWGEGPTYMLILLGAVLSGGYLPLQLWPDFMQGFLFVQPFAGYIDLPVRLYIGSMEPTQAGIAVSIQLGWTAVFIIAGRLLMRQRLKNVIVQGG